MNDQFNLKIKTPCSEDFDKFTPTRKGGYCGSCKKEVIDFTKMNSQDIINYFQSNETQNICGRFKDQQLRTYDHSIQKKRNFNLISGLGLAFITLFSFSKGYAQNVKKQTTSLDENPPKLQEVANKKNITVKGTVKEGDMPLPGVTVVLEGTTIGTTTDFDGNYKFPEKLKKGDILVFSSLGMNSKKVAIQNKNSDLNIFLEVNLEMDSCVLVGKVAVKKIYESKKD